MKHSRDGQNSGTPNCKVALLCGGPSLERGISLNSARTVLDHLDGENIQVEPVYFDQKRRPYLISRAQVYSNTPSDFDFKLQKTATPLTEERLLKELRKADIVFPAMHGPFGEDGEIQSFLEQNNIAFVGTPSRRCKLAFDKYHANNFIREQGFFAPPSIDLSINWDHTQRLEKIRAFFKQNLIERAIVKPARGGSSIGVFSVDSPEQAAEKAALLFSNAMDNKVVVEPFARGREFTAIIVENSSSVPVCILPTEIETDYTKHQIFDYRKKYLPTRQVTHHCPPHFSDQKIEEIQLQAEQLFSLFGFRDFARFDGWVYPDGNIWFSDFNPVSGMEQNSFLFQQSSRVGFSHRDFLVYILKNSCRRQGIDISRLRKQCTGQKPGMKKRVNVLFGGKTSERQVSLMSGTNAWLKLRRSDKYEPYPYLLDTQHRVWQLPYAYTLNHTVEEITQNCETAEKDRKRLLNFEKRVLEKLDLQERETSEETFIPAQLSVEEFIDSSPFVFLGLHGGDGENGILQEKMESRNKGFNGSGSATSRLCMDKWETARFIENMQVQGLESTAGSRLSVREIKKRLGMSNAQGNDKIRQMNSEHFWSELCKTIGSSTLIVKPKDDGCSTGIVKLESGADLLRYLQYLESGAEFMPAGEFSGQEDIVHLPQGEVRDLIFEEFIDTDLIRIQGDQLQHVKRRGWVETTIGLLESSGKVEVFNPSLTVAEGAVLTVEEKFQGGTGVNITPPPESIVSREALQRTKQLVKKLAEQIQIKAYARVDSFMHTESGAIKVIEVNTLPALTPSTVFYHQALAQDPPLYPTQVLEEIIERSRK